MPPAKKPAARRATRASTAPNPTAPITRKEVEAAAARFDKALEEANHALVAIRNDLGKGAKTAYQDIAGTLRALRRDAQKTTRILIKDLDKLRSSVTPNTAAARSTRKATTSKAPAKTATKRAATKAPTGAAGKPASSSASARTTAKKPAGPRRTA